MVMVVPEPVSWCIVGDKLAQVRMSVNWEDCRGASSGTEYSLRNDEGRKTKDPWGNRHGRIWRGFGERRFLTAEKRRGSK